MNEIAEQVLVALHAQQWAVVDYAEEGVVTYAPRNMRRIRLAGYLFDELTGDNFWEIGEGWVANIVILQINGLVWPWPPEPDELVKGSG